MLKRLLTIHKANHQSFFLFGPRGTGKTSWVKEYFPEALYIDLLKHEDYLYFQANPSKLEHRVLAHNSPWIIIDEVQKVPALLDEVHRLIEHHQYCFILTGSSSRQLKRGSANLLAGRAFTYHMHPLTAIELNGAFDVSKALKTGLLPRSYLKEESQRFLASYVATYLQQEVIQEGLVRQIGVFNRFMEIASFSQGNQLNLTSIAREVGVSRRIVAGYFDILEDLLMAIQLPCFTKRAVRHLVQHPKFYYFDTGIYQQLRPKGLLDSPEEITGPAFETLFLQNLRAVIDYYQLELTIYYWRTATGKEVDFIVYGEKGLFAFELKSRAYIERKDFSALKLFKEDYPMAQCLLIYGGVVKEKYGDMIAWPMKQALLELVSILGGNEGLHQ